MKLLLIALLLAAGQAAAQEKMPAAVPVDMFSHTGQWNTRMCTNSSGERGVCGIQWRFTNTPSQAGFLPFRVIGGTPTDAATITVSCSGEVIVHGEVMNDDSRSTKALREIGRKQCAR